MGFALIRKTVKSQSYTIAATGGAGSGFQVPLQFLEPALAGFRNAFIKRLRARISYNVDTGASGGPARLFPQVFSRVQIDDGAGPIVNLSGAELRIANIAERPGSYRDGLNVAASQTGATGEYWIDLLPTELFNEDGEHDHGMLVSDLMNGGQIYLTWASNLTPYAGYTTFNTTTAVEIYADVVEGVNAEGMIKLPPRLTWFSESISLVDYRYKLGGLMRWMIAYVGATAEDTLAGFSAQNLFSDDLKYQGYPLGYFRDTYKQTRDRTYDGDAAGTTAIEDPFLRTNPMAVAFWCPERGQMIGDLPLAESVQYRTDGSVGSDSPSMIKCVYTKRSPQLERAALGVSSDAAARAAIQTTGKVAGGKPVSAVTSGLAPFLPIRVKAAR